MTHTRLLAACLVGLLMPAAAVAQNREQQQVFADLRMLQEQVQRLQLTVNGLLASLDTTNGRLDEQASTARKEFADLRVVINDVTADMSALRENLYDNTTRVLEVTRELDAIRGGLADANGLLAQIVQLLSSPTMPVDLDTEAAPPGTPPTAPPATNLQAPRTTASPAAYYSQASGYYASGNFDLAIEAFADFLDRFPDAPKAAEAQFFIGEGHYQSGRYKDALDAFAVVTATYEGSEYVPGAYYRQGLCREQLGQRDQAIKLYQLLRAEHPDTVAGVNATQALIRLGIIKREGSTGVIWEA